MKKTTMTTEKRTYQTPAMQVVRYETVPLLVSVSGTDDYDDLHYGGDGDGSYGD